MNISEVIIARMKSKGIPKARVAKRIGATPSQFGRFLDGKASLSRESMNKCFEVLGFDLMIYKKRDDLARETAKLLKSLDIDKISKLTKDQIIALTGKNELRFFVEVSRNDYIEMMKSDYVDHESTYNYMKELIDFYLKVRNIDKITLSETKRTEKLIDKKVDYKTGRKKQRKSDDSGKGKTEKKVENRAEDKKETKGRKKGKISIGRLRTGDQDDNRHAHYLDDEFDRDVGAIDEDDVFGEEDKGFMDSVDYDAYDESDHYDDCDYDDDGWDDDDDDDGVCHYCGHIHDDDDDCWDDDDDDDDDDGIFDWVEGFMD